MPSIYVVPIGLTQISSETLITEEGSHTWVGRSSLLELPNGTWIHSYRSGTGHWGDGTAQVHVRFSSDQGVTWSAADTTLAGVAVTNMPATGHNSNDPNEGHLMLAPNGALLMFVREALSNAAGGTYLWRSTDNGATWSDEGKINNDDTLMMGNDAITVGALIYCQFWVDEGADQVLPSKTVLYVSDDNGATWTHVSDITSTAEGTNEGSLIQLADGTLLAVLRHDGVTKTYMRRSSDFGQTWGDLEDVTVRFGILHRPKFRRVDNRIYLHGRLYGGSGVTGYYVLYYTDDEAETWRGPYYVDPILRIDIGYGDVLARGDGNLYCVYYAGFISYSIIAKILAVG